MLEVMEVLCGLMTLNWFIDKKFIIVNRRILYICIFLCIPFMVMAQKKQKEIADNVFVPKGQWITGVSVSYSEHTEKDYQFLIIDKFNSDGYNFKFSPLVSYAIRDNMTLGGRFSYGRTLTKFDGLSLGLGDDLSFNLDDTYQLKHSYSVMGIMRNYINLGTSKRFALFAETQLKFGESRTKLVTSDGNELTGTFTTSNDIGIGVVPGIVAFVNNYTAVEVSVGVLGVDFSRTKHTTDQLYTGEQSSSVANFRINLFSVGLGIAFYL